MCLCVQRRLYSPSRMELFSKVRILRYFFIFLASSFLYHTGESVQPDVAENIPAYDQIRKGANCRSITPGTFLDIKRRIDGECSKAFDALTGIGLNVCNGWRAAQCRRISNTWECSALVPGPREMELRTLDSCGPNLPPPRMQPDVAANVPANVPAKVPANVPAYDQIRKGANCRSITPTMSQRYKRRIDGECSKAFDALTGIGLNVCTGWRSAQCRQISNTYECSALVPVPGGMETRTLDSCGANLPPSVIHMMTCFSGPGETSGTRKRRYSPPAPTAGSSRSIRFNPGPSSAHQASGSSFAPGVPPYTGGFSVGSSSSSIPPFSQGATSSFDVTRITRLGITREDLQSFANPSHVAQPSRLGMEGPSGVSGQSQSQGQGRGYSLGQAAGKQILSEAQPINAGQGGRVQCDQCGKWFRSPMGLYDHSFYHKGQTTCTRAPCGRIVFRDRSEFINHLKATHESELIQLPKSFECNKCDAKYVNIESLTRHMQVHTDQTICPFCTNSQRYSSKAALTGHIRSKHPEQWSAPPQK